MAGPSSGAPLFPDGLSYSVEAMSPAMEYVAKIKQHFTGDNERYREFIDILDAYKRTPVDEVFQSLTNLLALILCSRNILRRGYRRCSKTPLICSPVSRRSCQDLTPLRVSALSTKTSEEQSKGRKGLLNLGPLHHLQLPRENEKKGIGSANGKGNGSERMKRR